MQLAQLHPFSRQRLSIFGNLTVTFLLICTVLLTGIKLGVGRAGGPTLPLPLGMLLGAILVATGIRWTPLVGTVLFILYLIAYYLQPFVAYHLMHPKEQMVLFVTMLVLIGLPAMGLVTSVVAFMQNYRRDERSIPRWFAPVCSGFAGVLIGALLLGIIMPATPASANSQASSINGVPAVHMSISGFLQPSVTISKGSKLYLVDDGSYKHLLANGSWVDGQPQVEQQPGAPAINNLAVNGNTVEIGPFTTAGTYHILCQLHTGMMLTVIVQ